MARAPLPRRKSWRRSASIPNRTSCSSCSRRKVKLDGIAAGVTAALVRIYVRFSKVPPRPLRRSPCPRPTPYIRAPDLTSYRTTRDAAPAPARGRLQAVHPAVAAIADPRPGRAESSRHASRAALPRPPHWHRRGGVRGRRDRLRHRHPLRPGRRRAAVRVARHGVPDRPHSAPQSARRQKGPCGSGLAHLGRLARRLGLLCSTFAYTQHRGFWLLYCAGFLILMFGGAVNGLVMELE